MPKIDFLVDFKRFQELCDQATPRFDLRWEDRWPIINENTPQQAFDYHYVFHTAWAARAVAALQPALHVDVSSSVYFCSIVSAFVPMKFYDYRPIRLNLTNLTTDSADLSALPFESQSIESISCMHVVEHIGLGRYGDQLDPDGDLKAISELIRVLRSGGSLFFVVPVGKPRILFNAHRIYSYRQILEYHSELRLKEFALIPDNAGHYGLVTNATQEMSDSQNYGCGCFWFVRD